MSSQKYIFSLYPLIYVPCAIYSFNKPLGVPARVMPHVLLGVGKTTMHPSNSIPVLIDGKNEIL